MSTQPNILQSQSSADSSGGGFFSRIGAGLKQIMPYITPIANRLAAAGGNYAPLELEHQQREDALHQQLAQSSMDTASLNRQLLQKQVDNYRTPEQVAAASIQQAGALERERNANAPPTDIIAPMESGGMGHFNRTFNSQTNQWETNPTTVPSASVPNPTQATLPSPMPPVGPQAPPTPAIPPPLMGHLLPPSPTVTPAPHQLPAMSKPVSSGGDIEPDSNSITGFSRVWRSPDLREIGRQPAPAPYAYVPSETSGVNTTLKQDANGNWVAVQEPHSSTKTPVMPGGGNSNPRSALPRPTATPVTDGSGNPVHAPLGADAKKNIGQIDAAQNFIQTLLPALNQRAAQIKQAGGDANSLWDMGQQRAAWAEYKLGKDPTNIDPTLARILPLVAQLEIVGGLPYLRGTRSFQYIQQIQQHLPDPAKDTPALMLEKLNTLQQTLPLLKKAAIESEMNPLGNNSAPSVLPSTGSGFTRF